MFTKIIFLCQFILVSNAWSSAFSGNKIEDLFIVKSMDSGKAVATGDAKGVKVGSSLYFARSPYQFKVIAVNGNSVTVALPENSDLKLGQSLLRNLTDQIRSNLTTESQLKAAED